jgi:hypothetical protein
LRYYYRDGKGSYKNKLRRDSIQEINPYPDGTPNYLENQYLLKINLILIKNHQAASIFFEIFVGMLGQGFFNMLLDL